MVEAAGGVNADAGVSDLDVLSVTSSDECCRFSYDIVSTDDEERRRGQIIP